VDKQDTLPCPLITIGITTYNNISTHFNNESVLKRGLDSFVNQDYPNLEIIIQDDCSTDRTFEICQEYAKTYSFIKILRNKQNLGAVLNINLLVSRANGDFFLWGCVDDVYAKDYISKCYEKLKSEPTKSVCQTYIKTIYPDKNVSEYYEDINPPITSRAIHELNQILFKRQHYLGKCSALNPLIHGLIRIKSAQIVFSHPSMLFYELVIPIFLIWMGGLCVVKEILFTNEAKRFFKERYPKSEYVRKTSSKYHLLIIGIRLFIYIIKIYCKGEFKVNFTLILKTWIYLFNFYYLYLFRVIGLNLKVKVMILKIWFFNYVRKYSPLLLYIYRFLKRKLQINS
jgi:glycosyltransferase involved in cell wall biosynthesis